MSYRKVNLTGAHTANSYQPGIGMNIGKLSFSCDSDNKLRISTNINTEYEYYVYQIGCTSEESGITHENRKIKVTKQFQLLDRSSGKNEIGSFMSFKLYSADTSDFYTLDAVPIGTGNVHLEGHIQGVPSILAER